MSNADQLPLFDVDLGQEPPGPETPPPPSVTLAPQTPIFEALTVYLYALERSGASFHTIKAFKSDIGLLAQWAGDEKPIGEFGTRDLNRFLKWMKEERGRPCSPKTYARRVTALKHFFGYLFDEAQAIPRDPSNAVIQHTVAMGLPDVLSDQEVEQALTASTIIRKGIAGERPDARPYSLLTLILETGIKKSEASSLYWHDVIRDHPDGPQIWIRYSNPKLRYKERLISISTDWLRVLAEYTQQQKKKGETIFNRTPRLLEYVLRDIANQAGLPATRLSFETLRWTCALHDYKEGMEPEKLRQKLGISRITWVKTSERLSLLTKGPASEEADSA